MCRYYTRNAFKRTKYGVVLQGLCIDSDINECSSGSCRNGGTCNDDVKPYICTCTSGFTGVECATEIDECSSSPCQNGASCTDNVNSYTCTCFDGYTGINCDTDAEPFSFSGVIWLIFGIGIGVTISIIACIIYILIKRTRTRKRTDDTDDPPHIYFSAVADSNTNHEYESMTQSGRLPSRNLDITGQYLQVVSSTAFDAKDHHVGLGN